MQTVAKVYPFPSQSPAADLPSPLCPADADMTGFHFMPVPTDTLKSSRDWSRAKREPLYGYRFMTLAMAAFRQRPAGSLPDDDQVLADALGIDDEAWACIKGDTMREWRLCADGRWHHPVVAEIVAEAWKAKKANRARNEGMLAGKEAKRASKGVASRDDGRDHVVTRREGRKEGSEGSEGSEENQRISSASPAGEPRRKGSSSSAKGTRIPDDWQPDREYAAEQGMQRAEIDREAENFRDYWQAKPGAQALKLDWGLTWNTWVRRYVERRGSGASTPRRCHSAMSVGGGPRSHPDSF